MIEYILPLSFHLPVPITSLHLPSSLSGIYNVDERSARENGGKERRIPTTLQGDSRQFSFVALDAVEVVAVSRDLQHYSFLQLQLQHLIQQSNCTIRFRFCLLFVVYVYVSI